MFDDTEKLTFGVGQLAIPVKPDHVVIVQYSGEVIMQSKPMEKEACEALIDLIFSTNWKLERFDWSTFNGTIR